MNSIVVEIATLSSILGGAAFGMWLRTALPADHLTGDSKSTIKAGIGLVGTMTAMILGLLVSSAKNTYDMQNAELTRLSASVVVLDRILGGYGPEAKGGRDELRLTMIHLADLLDSGGRSGPSELDPYAVDAAPLYDRIQQLSPNDDSRRFLKGQALIHAVSIGETRWLLYQQATTSGVSMPLLVTLVCWLTIIFASLGLFTPVNATTIVCMFVCALSVSLAIWLILEMYTPYTGLIRVSSTPLRTALESLGH